MCCPSAEAAACVFRASELPIPMWLNLIDETLLGWSLWVAMEAHILFKTEHIFNLFPTGRIRGRQARITLNDESMAVKR